MIHPSNKELIVLVHGFFRNYKDMLSLSNYLEKSGYITRLVNLPTTFKSLEDIYLSFQTEIKKIHEADYTKIHLVGHSMGGLVIRYYLARHVISNLGRCICIASPNQGTYLADIGMKIPLLSTLLKPIKALHSNTPPIPLPLNRPLPEFGIIAGSNPWLSTGIFLQRPNDGRVEVDATQLDEVLMKAFIVLPYVHTKIHHKEETAVLVKQFLEQGHFEVE